MKQSAVTVSGDPDTANASQYLEAQRIQHNQKRHVSTSVNHTVADPYIDTVMVDSSGGAVDVTLPDVGVVGRRLTVILDVGGNDVTLKTENAAVELSNIDGSVGRVVGKDPGDRLDVISAGSHWWVVGGMRSTEKVIANIQNDYVAPGGPVNQSAYITGLTIGQMYEVTVIRKMAFYTANLSDGGGFATFNGVTKIFEAKVSELTPGGSSNLYTTVFLHEATAADAHCEVTQFGSSTCYIDDTWTMRWRAIGKNTDVTIVNAAP